LGFRRFSWKNVSSQKVASSFSVVSSGMKYRRTCSKTTTWTSRSLVPLG
jgi:hypothetical protein